MTEKLRLDLMWNPYPKVVPQPQDSGEYFITYIDERGEKQTTRCYYDYGNLGPWCKSGMSFTHKVIAWAPIPVFEYEPYTGDGFELDGN